MRTDSIRLSGLVLAGLAAGCASQPSPRVATPPVAKAAANGSSPALAAKAKQASQRDPAKTPSALMSRLIGMDEAGIRVMLGEPSSTREDPPTKLWVYRLRKCTMEVTFYPEVETRKFHALNYEVTNDDGSSRRRQQCIADFSARFPATAAK